MESHSATFSPSATAFSVGKFTPDYRVSTDQNNEPLGVPILDENVGCSPESQNVGTVEQGQPLLFIKNPHQINLDGQIALARDVDGDGKISNGDIKKSTDELSAMLEKNGVIMGASLAHMGYVPMILRLDGRPGIASSYFVIPKLLQADGIEWVENGAARLHDVKVGDKLVLDGLRAETATSVLAEFEVEPSDTPTQIQIQRVISLVRLGASTTRT